MEIWIPKVFLSEVNLRPCQTSIMVVFFKNGLKNSVRKVSRNYFHKKFHRRCLGRSEYVLAYVLLEITQESVVLANNLFYRQQSEFWRKLQRLTSSALRWNFFVLISKWKRTFPHFPSTSFSVDYTYFSISLKQYFLRHLKYQIYY